MTDACACVCVEISSAAAYQRDGLCKFAALSKRLALLGEIFGFLRAEVVRAGIIKLNFTGRAWNSNKNATTPSVV